MKKGLLLVLTLFMSIVGYAYDIAVENADGVTIYYNYYNNGTELEVTRKSSSSSDRYSGVVNIPEEVTYMGRTRKVTSIGTNAFYNCRSLTSVTIPNSVTTIGWNAFSDCSGLTSVTIGNSVTTIGERAFESCHGLTSVTIPSSVTSIEGAAFSDCSGLTSVHITDIAAWCKISFGDNPLDRAHHLYLNGEEIKDLVIPNSVTSIGGFGGCHGLTSVTIPNSVTTIRGSAFKDCTGLTSVTIPNSVTSIGRFAFGYCSGLTSVTIPSSVTSIEGWVFYKCSSLTSVNIPNSVTSIEGGVFQGCSSLTSVTIPNSVTFIGYDAFSDCSGLTSVNIGNSVTFIGERAFQDCSGLTSVVSKMENPCSIYGNCFDQDVFYNVTLYVPKGTTDKYKSTNFWSKFVFIEEGEPGGSVIPDPNKCSTPTISYADKELTFSCKTEGVEYVYEIKDTDIKKGYEAKVSLSATYEISVYATKSGYENSDMATATLVWTEAIFTETTPTTPTSAKAVTESIPVLISANNGNITVKSEANGQSVAVYSVEGQLLGNATVSNGQATVSTTLQDGNVAVVKVGNKSVKILMK